ncbi:lasso peptide biosynthesis B2 protein [Sphingomonas sp. OTU376]|uniref:lasso peptide biosynthesis B2 protein n=1 Tax=Sphingomonas sp. OTU376 TaxID=3043863 RepID=UPI00313E8EA0
MSYELGPGLSYVCSGGQFVFLDEHADRYFALSGTLEAAFAAVVATGDCDAISARRLAHMAVLLPSAEPGHIRPVDPSEIRSAALAIKEGRCGSLDVVRAIIDQRLAMYRMRRHGLAVCLRGLRQLKAKRQPAHQLDGGSAEPAIRAFELAKLLFAHADRCLPRSLALATRLVRSGVHAELVLGVSSIPFTAHAWVQAGDVVLNDTPEEVRKYDAILRI